MTPTSRRRPVLLATALIAGGALLTGCVPDILGALTPSPPSLEQVAAEFDDAIEPT